jgi:hypothetical protein
MSAEAHALLHRALDLSCELLAAAERGETEAAVRLDAERLRLLKSARNAAKGFEARQTQLWREIGRLNDQSIGALEHHRRIKARQLDVAAVGRRAVNAYATTRLMRRS